MAAANNEFFEALSMLEHERGITAEYLIEKIKAAIIIAVKKNYEVEEDHVKVDIAPAAGRFDVALIQDVVADEDWNDEHSEIGITEAQKIRKSYEVGDRIVTPLKTKDFGRIAAQTAKHVIRQGIREAERSQQLSEIQSRAHDIVQATVTRVDPEKGIVALDLGKGGEAILPHNEQVPGEVYTEGQSLQVYVVDVVSTERGPRVMISRTHPGLVKRLFELEVPEIYDGTVEVKAISREAGARTKMAVWSKDPNVNPVSACIGPHGDRVAAVVEKLGGEKIDIVKWSEDISEFISAALSPAKVVKVELLPGETRSCRVTVPDQQLSLAIGNKGQNARLCAPAFYRTSVLFGLLSPVSTLLMTDYSFLHLPCPGIPFLGIRPPRPRPSSSLLVPSRPFFSPSRPLLCIPCFRPRPCRSFFREAGDFGMKMRNTSLFGK